MAQRDNHQNNLLRALPSIDSLLKTEAAQSLKAVIGAENLTSLARRVTEELRQQVIAGGTFTTARVGGDRPAARDFLAEAERRLAAQHNAEIARRLQRVINATGVILHTNLGRAPLSEASQRAITEAAEYCTLEYDLASGSRGRRGARAEDLLVSLTGAEAALVVNNCAAAALLALTALARDGETIISRGELVEIGGDFRVPEVMAQSGTRMIEVGTTNRTKLADYRKAISANTRLILRVHTSNYRIVGFTKTPTLHELAVLAHDAGLLLYEDAGSGAIFDIGKYGISGEPIIRESFEAGADVISFSGDKLLGGPQIGLLVGRANQIELMRRHPLYRTLRADKLRIAGLEATLESYFRRTTESDIPAHRMIAMPFAEIKSRSEDLINRLHKTTLSKAIRVETIEGESAIGGGAAPTSQLKTLLISISHARLSANQVAEMLRHSSPPVVTRIEANHVLLDLRTVLESDEASLAAAIVALPA